MSPTSRTIDPTPSTSADPTYSHQVSIPAMVTLALFLSMMAALTIGVILRQRAVTAAALAKLAVPQDASKQAQAQTQPKPRASPSESWFSCLRIKPKPKPKLMSKPRTCTPDTSHVGALHATSVLLAGAPCHLFSPMAMHFRIPIQDGQQTVLILGAPWPWFNLPGYDNRAASAQTGCSCCWSGLDASFTQSGCAEMYPNL